MKHLLNTAGALLLAASTSLLAGPPLICHPVEISGAKSLPWKAVNGWNGVDSQYDVARLTADTLGLLTPTTPLNVRMETLRRAAVYSVLREGTVDQLTSQLLARAANAEAAGRADGLAWFDAGYYVEAMRQMTFVRQYDMLSPAERAAWKWRNEQPQLDGKPWIDRANHLGVKGAAVALAKINEYRQADLKKNQQAAVRP